MAVVTYVSGLCLPGSLSFMDVGLAQARRLRHYRVLWRFVWHKRDACAIIWMLAWHKRDACAIIGGFIDGGMAQAGACARKGDFKVHSSELKTVTGLTIIITFNHEP